MKMPTKLHKTLRYRLWRIAHARLIFADLLRPGSEPQGDHRAHLSAAVDWLTRAQDVRDAMPDRGGVSAGWSFEDGWLPSYPETSGYIIETFIAAAQVLDRPGLIVRANRIIDWELSSQQSDGAFPGHFGEPASRPVIFNTGQIMHGMLSGYLQLEREECLASAIKAANWLAKHQDGDGCWRRYEHNDVPHVYNTRATWALVRTALLIGDEKLKAAAVRNLDWALTQQTDCGWFATNAFVPGRAPFTHTIAYAIRGFFESGLLLRGEKYIAAALKAARALARAQETNGSLAGMYADNWIPASRSCCLTGVAQMSLNWTRLAQSCGAGELKENARRALAYLKTSQRLRHRDPNIKGAIAGSLPIWGSYSRFEFPNWAAKFFADALMTDLAEIAIPPLDRAMTRSEVEYV